jgi:protoporphyrinogen/coproporphyrinogen III oxidase
VPDALIIGGGIAGLSAAWELVQRGRRPLVLEAGERPGGLIKTESTAGFVIDAGPDALLTQKPAALELCRELGLADRLFPTLMPRTAFVLRGGRLVPLPEASVLGLPTKVKPFLTTPLFSWRAKARMAAELLIPPRRDDQDESIGSFMERRFGREVVTFLAEPLLAGIHAGDVYRLSIRSAFPRLVEAERTHGSVLRAFSSMRAAPSDRGAFVSLPGGIGELVDTLVAKLPAGTIRGHAEATSITGGGPFTVTLRTGDALQAPLVIVATPAWAAAPLVRSLAPEVADLIARVPYASSATVVIALRRDQVRHSLQGTGYVVPRVERRTLMAASWVSSKWPNRAPEGMVLLRGFVGGAHDEAILERRDEEIVDAALSELTPLLSIGGLPSFARVYRWPRGNAQHEVGHLELMAQTDRRLAAVPGLYVTGSGFRGTGVPDCVADGRATGAIAAAFLG